MVGQDEIVKRLQSYVKSRNLPHLLFSGPPGVGKTASAIAVAKELFGDTWTNNFTELNASDERGIDVVRNKIKNFARTSPLGEADFKIIFLDEADALTSDAQSALRRTMEKYTSNCRFILSCNYSSKIIDPIQSRCAVYRFAPISLEAIQQRIAHIAGIEGLEVNDEGMEAIKYVSMGDMRKAINALQAAGLLDKKIDMELDGDFIGARTKLDTLRSNQGLSGEDIIVQIHRTMFDKSIPDILKVKLMDRIGEIDFRLTEGANERIQLEALLAYFVLAGKGNDS